MDDLSSLTSPSLQTKALYTVKINGIKIMEEGMAATAEGLHPFSSEHGSKVLQRFWLYYGARAHGNPETLPAYYNYTFLGQR